MLSVVIPALNEEEAITQTVTTAREVLERNGIAPVEVIVVDDGSSDATGARAAAVGARVIRHPHNVGYGRSLKDGILAASYDTIAISDADGTYPLEDLPVLFAMKNAGYDMVVGARTGPYYQESMIKSPLRWVLRLIVEWTAGRRIPDINSGLRVFSRDITLRYFDRLCDTFSFTTSLTLAYMMNSRFVAYREIDYKKRIGHTRVRLFRDALKTLQFITEAAVYYNPLKIFTLLAFLCLVAATLSIAVGLITHFATLFMLGAGAILAGIIVLSLGFVCVLLKQIMDGGTRMLPGENAALAAPTTSPAEAKRWVPANPDGALQRQERLRSS
ncbi:MAG: glycosyltransferase family 2 protein [Gemmatimonas sp.]